MPRFQFTIRGLLWATFWVAVWAASATAFSRLTAKEEWPLLPVIALLGIAESSPFMAIVCLIAPRRKILVIWCGWLTVFCGGVWLLTRTHS